MLNQIAGNVNLLPMIQQYPTSDAGLLNKSSYSTQALGVPQLTITRSRLVEQKLMLSSSFRRDQIHCRILIWSHFVVRLKSDLDVQQTHPRYDFGHTLKLLPKSDPSIHFKQISRGEFTEEKLMLSSSFRCDKI
jgi:hypothetical protein